MTFCNMAEWPFYHQDAAGPAGNGEWFLRLWIFVNIGGGIVFKMDIKKNCPWISQVLLSWDWQPEITRDDRGKSLKYNIIKLTSICFFHVCHCLFGVEWQETDLNRAGHHQSDTPPPPESSASIQSQLCSLLASLHIFCLAADSESSPVLLWQESKCEVIWGDLCEKKRSTGSLRLEVTVLAGTAPSHGQVSNCGQTIYPRWSDQDSCITVRQLSPQI